MTALYDTIGIDYARLRQPDPRIAAAIHAQLGDARTVLNVGAGAGSYEPDHLQVTAVEPSAEMIRQRPPGDTVVVQGSAEALPFDDNSFDAAQAVLTVHHWQDFAKGAREMRRVTRGPLVFLTVDADNAGFWLQDYLPALRTLDQDLMPNVTDFEAALGPVERITVPVPHDCLDGFLCAYWRRPAAYLDPRVRQSMSPFSMIGDVTNGLARLEDDLECGAWTRKYAALLGKESHDCGYHLIVAR